MNLRKITILTCGIMMASSAVLSSHAQGSEDGLSLAAHTSSGSVHLNFDDLIEAKQKSNDSKATEQLGNKRKVRQEQEEIVRPDSFTDLEATTRLQEIIGHEAFVEDKKIHEITLQDERKEPNWEPVISQYAVTGFQAKECCLRVIRSTRFSAEDACKAQGKEVWAIESNRPTDLVEKPDRYKGSCAIYELKTNNRITGYSCQAQAVAKCITASN